jgi:hypothetical protein
MTDDKSDGVWRDEEKLPLSELNKAMASWDLDGQNDPTDNDAGAEQAFGNGAEADPDGVDAGSGPDRPVRPSTTGRTGPH